MKEYALYKGDNLLTMGTISEVAEFHKVKPATIRFMTTPSYNRRKKPGGNHLVVIKLDDDMEDDD